MAPDYSNYSLQYGGYADWEAAMMETKKHHPSWHHHTRLQPISDALKNYLNPIKPNYYHIRKFVDEAIAEAGEDHEIRQKHSTLLRWLLDEVDEITPRFFVNNQSQYFGIGIGDKLNKLGNSSVTDLLSFPGNANEGLKGMVFARYYCMTPEERTQDGQAGGMCRMTGVTLSILASVYGLVNSGHAGCCTTFATAAAHLLTGGLRGREINRPRVEIVSWEVPQTRIAHCFVLVGRNNGGLNENGKIDVASIPDSVDVVDPWFGSLGHETIYNYFSSYKSTKLERIPQLNQVFDSYMTDQEAINQSTSAADRAGPRRVARAEELLAEREEQRRAEQRRQYVQEHQKQ